MPQIRHIEYYDSYEEAEERGRQFYDQWGYGYSPRYHIKQIDEVFEICLTHWDTCD